MCFVSSELKTERVLDERASIQRKLLLLFAAEEEADRPRDLFDEHKGAFFASCSPKWVQGIEFRAWICSSIVKRTLTKAEFNFIIRRNHCRCSSMPSDIIFFVLAAISAVLSFCHCRRTREGQDGGRRKLERGGNKSDRILFYNRFHLRANIFRRSSKSFRCSESRATELNHILRRAVPQINITFHSFTAAESRRAADRGIHVVRGEQHAQIV